MGVFLADVNFANFTIFKTSGNILRIITHLKFWGQSIAKKLYLNIEK